MVMVKATALRRGFETSNSTSPSGCFRRLREVTVQFLTTSGLIFLSFIYRTSSQLKSHCV